MLNRPNPMPDIGLHNSLAWVHTMPQGPGHPAPIHGGPVVEYQTRTVTERTSGQQTEVVEWLYALITRAHLNTGTNPNPAMRQWVQNEVGVRADHAGHIIANRLGGLGTVRWNIFPQNSNINSGVNRADVEDMIYSEVQRRGSLRVWYNFVYDDAAHPGRPGSFRWFFVASPGGDISGDLPNPLSLAEARASG